MPVRSAPPLGVIMLDTRFERPPGDVGNALSWPFPVLYRTVAGATARSVIDGREERLLDAFVEAGEDLGRQGACALVTSCGFLVRRQSYLAARLKLPLATSSLLQIPAVQRLLPAGKTVGVVTYDEHSLTAAHFAEAGVAEPVLVAGLPKGGRFHEMIEGEVPYRREMLEEELLGTVAALLARSSGIGAIVLECTNLPPFSPDIAKRFGLPVFDVLTLGRWLHASAAMLGRTVAQEK
ncbi:aspartate/glutamate racemase family protein [Rhizobiaceae bacterium BDR2-2]|uniref:Aspartate/glutamate racemase family protein n=1 Tax=Ectorhizobium quercum TaxID=2965071 RepID=A0AAE3MVA0_9HYPH|nr:aspartate/glutamate racemase family protein [Ectorhizobium quercum]MCX8995524.1 aspartate/glutamate racemase family protein [Ectorhizobium quercum]